MNLFVSTRKLTGRHEDHLTEFFTATFDVNREGISDCETIEQGLREFVMPLVSVLGR